MSFSRDSRTSQPSKTPAQEWQAFIDDLSRRKPQPPAFYTVLKESSLGSIDREKLTIFFPTEELKSEANKLRPKIQAALPVGLQRDKVFCQVGSAPQQTVVTTPVAKSFTPARQSAQNQLSRGVSSSAIKSPLQALNFEPFLEDNKGKELSQPILQASADADATCGKLYEQLTKRTRTLAKNGIVLNIEFPWRLRVGGMRGFRELLLPAFHPVYGVPYIPASSLKGAALAWARRNGEESEAHKLLGTLEHGMGHVQILDAFSSAPSLSVDMANPQWHWDKDKNHVKYSPEPHALLTMEEPALVIGLLPTSRGQKRDVEVVKEWLEEALKEGIGSRVSAGYGRAGLGASFEHSQIYDFKLWSQGIYGASPPSRENNWEGTLEFRPVALRGVLRYWFRAVALGIYAAPECQQFEEQLFGSLGKQGNLNIGVEWHESSGGPPYLCDGKILLEAKSSQELELIKKILFLSSLLGGIGRGSRRPLHLNDKRMRGCYWEVKGSVLPNSQEAWQKFLGQVHKVFIDAQKPTSKPGDGNPGEGARNRRYQDVLNHKAQICLMPSAGLIHPENVHNWQKEGNRAAVRGEALELLYSSERYKGRNRDGKGNPNVGGTLEAPSFVLIKSNFPEKGQPYQAVTTFGADHKDRAEFAKVLVREGASRVWPL
jgi:CRISPR-associated protein Cmr6